jgi:hypothetical protein
MQNDLIRRVTAIAERHHGHVSTAQLLAAGASQAWIARQVAAGWLVPVRRGCYRIGPPTVASARHAALGDGGPGAMIVSLHGLDLLSIRDKDVANEPIRIWTPSHRRNRAGVEFFRAHWITAADARTVTGLRVASPEVCIATAAPHFDAVDLVALIKEACFRDRGVVDRLVQRARDTRFRGSGKILTAADWYLNGHCGLDSATEKYVRSRLRSLRAADGFVINARLRLSDGLMRVDVYWPHAGFVLEVNPDGHKREWVKLGDLGRKARVERDGLDSMPLDTTQPQHIQDEVFRRVVERSHRPRTGPYVDFIRPG